MISLLLLEHPPLIRRALVARLLLESDLCVLAEADHAAEAVRHAQALHPEVVLLDAQMPNLNVAETVRQLRARSKNTGGFRADDLADDQRFIARFHHAAGR